MMYLKFFPQLFSSQLQTVVAKVAISWLIITMTLQIQKCACGW